MLTIFQPILAAGMTYQAPAVFSFLAGYTSPYMHKWQHRRMPWKHHKCKTEVPRRFSLYTAFYSHVRVASGISLNAAQCTLKKFTVSFIFTFKINGQSLGVQFLPKCSAFEIPKRNNVTKLIIIIFKALWRYPENFNWKLTLSSLMESIIMCKPWDWEGNLTKY